MNEIFKAFTNNGTIIVENKEVKDVDSFFGFDYILTEWTSGEMLLSEQQFHNKYKKVVETVYTFSSKDKEEVYESGNFEQVMPAVGKYLKYNLEYNS